MKNFIAIILLCGTLIGCANTLLVAPVYTQKGEKAFTINCSGDDSSWGQCIQMAGELCREKGYSIEYKNTERGSFKTTIFNGLGAFKETRLLTVRCNETAK